MGLRQTAAMLACGMIFAASANAQNDFSDVEISAEHAGGNVHVLYGAGGNIGVLKTQDGVVLIDDQFAPLTDRILDAVAELNNGPVRFVLNTHWHGDHTGGNENLGKKGAIIIAHDNVHERLSEPQTFANANRNTDARPKAAQPLLSFNDELSLYLGEEARAYHVAHAHTDGDSFVYFKDSDVVHMGDLFFNGNYPYIDLDSGGNLLGVIEGMKRALDVSGPETTFIPGHGPLASRTEAQAYVTVLEVARDRVQALINEGKSLEEVKKAKPMSDYDEDWGTGFVNPDFFLTAVFNSLTTGR